jgi:hypothetical protein
MVEKVNDDATTEDEDEEAGQGGDIAEPVDQDNPLPASLIEDLSAQKTAALRIELARAPDIAFALVVHALVTAAFYQTGERVLKAWLTTRSLRPSIKEHETCAAIAALAKEAERIRASLMQISATLVAKSRNPTLFSEAVLFKNFNSKVLIKIIFVTEKVFLFVLYLDSNMFNKKEIRLCARTLSCNRMCVRN